MYLDAGKTMIIEKPDKNSCSQNFNMLFLSNILIFLCAPINEVHNLPLVASDSLFHICLVPFEIFLMFVVDKKRQEVRGRCLNTSLGTFHIALNMFSTKNDNSTR